MRVATTARHRGLANFAAMSHVVESKDVEQHVQRTCVLESVQEGRQNHVSEGTTEVRVVSWNVLAQVYTRSSWFPHAPAPSIRWKRRFQTIAFYLKHLRADIYLLQEVDNLLEYEELFKQMGYGLKYKRRTGTKKDGSAIAYRFDRFQCLGIQEIEYNELVGYIKDNDKDAEENRSRYHRDCIGILAALKEQNSGKVLCAATTHLFWNPDMNDVKLAQAQLFISRIGHFANSWRTTHTIAGLDANSIPDSDVYRVLTGVAPSSTSKRVFSAPFKEYQMRSAYVTATGHNPAFTTHIPQFIAPIDYMLHSPNIRISAILKIAQEGDESIGNGMPNYYHPSDHLPLAADFVLQYMARNTAS